MSGPEMLRAAALLGAFVLLAGCYGLGYGLGRLRGRRQWTLAGYAAYALQCAVTAAVLAFTPLLAGWKAFIVLSCLAYLAIPPLAWRGLAALHRLEEHRS